MCSYTVASGDSDTDGIEVKAAKLAGTIKNASDVDATLTYTPLTAQSSHKVDGVAPTVSTVAVTSAAGSDDTYATGDTIEVTVTFGEAIVVTGTPQLTIKVGTADKTATCARKGPTGADATKLACTYTVASGDADSDGISIEADKLSLPMGASITDAADNDATRTHRRDWPRRPATR